MNVPCAYSSLAVEPAGEAWIVRIQIQAGTRFAVRHLQPFQASGVACDW